MLASNSDNGRGRKRAFVANALSPLGVRVTSVLCGAGWHVTACVCVCRTEASSRRFVCLFIVFLLFTKIRNLISPLSSKVLQLKKLNRMFGDCVAVVHVYNWLKNVVLKKMVRQW